MKNQKKVDLIDAGRRELYHIDKKMSQFQTAISSKITPQTFKGIISQEAL